MNSGSLARGSFFWGPAFTIWLPFVFFNAQEADNSDCRFGQTWTQKKVCDIGDPLKNRTSESSVSHRVATLTKKRVGNSTGFFFSDTRIPKFKQQITPEKLPLKYPKFGKAPNSSSFATTFFRGVWNPGWTPWVESFIPMNWPSFFWTENLPGLAWRLDWSTSCLAERRRTQSLVKTVGNYHHYLDRWDHYYLWLVCFEHWPEDFMLDHCHPMGVGEFATCFQAFRKQWKVPSFLHGFFGGVLGRWMEKFWSWESGWLHICLNLVLLGDAFTCGF